MFREGGCSSDIDRLCNLSFDSFLPPNTKLCLPTYKDSNFSHDFMATAPGNPLFRDAIERNVSMRRDGNSSLYEKGPPAYFGAVSHFLLGYESSENPNAITWNTMRSILDLCPSIYIH